MEVLLIKLIFCDNNEYKDFYSPKTFYGRTNRLYFKLCHDYCETCNEIGLSIHYQKCFSCLKEYTYDYLTSIHHFTENCVPYDYLYDEEDNKLKLCNSTLYKFYYNASRNYERYCFKSDLNCPEEYPYLNETTNECLNYIPFIPTTIPNTKEEIEINDNTELTQNMINNLFQQLNIYNMYNRKDILIFGRNISIVAISAKNKNNNENMITIDLGKCENILKEKYNISKNDSLYILLYIFEEDGMKIPKVEYEVYYPFLYNNNYTKLNLTLCKDTKIEISIPVKINDNIDKYNPKSAYYNDICCKATSESGTDICLKDRRNEFIRNNMILCEENCEFIDYNYIIKKVKCFCDIKTNINPNYDIKFNKKEFYKGFTDIKNIANIEVLKCYKIAFIIKNLIYNYGFYIMTFILLLFFITCIIFWLVSYKKLKTDLFNMSIILKSINSIEVNPEIKNNKNLRKKRSIKNNKINRINGLNNFRQITQNSQDKLSEEQNIIKIFKTKSFNKNNQYINELLKQKDFEINSLEYEEALKLDTRNYFLYYISLLKYNHPIIFSFGFYNDYNSRIIRIFLFFFSFSSDLTINALFFNDDTMHKIYQDKGNFDLLYQIPQILYSTLISKFIDILIKNLALFQDNIIELKQEKGINNSDKKFAKILNIIRVKIILYFVSAFIILSFYWYYIICFCGVYVNTQIHLIKDTIISLITSLIYPFVIYLIPGIFRIIALRIEKSSGKYLYKFSSFLENYLC